MPVNEIFFVSNRHINVLMLVMQVLTTLNGMISLMVMLEKRKKR